MTLGPDAMTLGRDTMTRPRILVLGCVSSTAHGHDEMRRISLQARRRGLHIIGADYPASLNRAPVDLLDELVGLPVHDTGACRSWAATTRPRIDAAFTFREMCVEPVAAICHELGIAGNAPTAVHLSRHKDLARARLREAGLPQPTSLLTTDPWKATVFMQETGSGPWIIKPRDGLGSQGVSLVRDAHDIGAALEKLESGVPFLLETFVSGPEYSAEGVLLDGAPRVLAITEKFTAGGFVETGHRIPAGLDDATTRQAQAQVERALLAVGITHGIFHVEFWATENGIIMGELHARPGGDFIHALVEHSRPGLELYGLLMDDLLSRPTPAIPEQTAASGVDYLLLPPGRVRSLHGWEHVARDPAVIAAHLEIGPGDRIGPVHGSADRHGLIAVQAPTRAQVNLELDRLRAALHIDVEPQ